MIIDEVIAFCAGEFKKLNAAPCLSCNHPQNICSKKCELCLEQVHYPEDYPEGRRDYDYECMAYFYPCKFLYRYASEICYLLQKSELIAQMPEYNVLSVGCGPAPDLMAFEKYCSEEGIDKKITYKGFDKNPIWSSIHDIILEGAQQDTVDFFEQSIEEAERILNCNVLSLQYVISFFYHNKIQDNLPEFISSIVDIVSLNKRQNEPFVVLINDVNHNRMGRNDFSRIAQGLTRANLNNTSTRFYFDYYDINDAQRVGNKHDTNTIIFDVSNEVEEYSPWRECRAAQMLIEVI